MNPVVVLNERIENKSTYKATQTDFSALDSQTILIATIDHDIRAALTDLLESANIEVICVSSVKGVKALIGKKRISACLCGFWLQDGTYREVIRHLRRERMDIPAIIISAPTCPQEFREYLAAINLGALDVLSYPFQRSDFDRMLEFAILSRSSSVRQQAAEEAAQFEVRGAA
jgi:DNA-binding NtrC family response regulator